MPYLSIIVPIYNVKKYLRTCIESILNQRYKDFELILVDDGSKDGSSEICDEYKKMDSRVTVIHKENRGHTEARKTGLTVAEGKYVAYVDGDDWIDPDMYEMLIQKSDHEKADMVICGFVSERLSEQIYEDNHLPAGIYYDEKLIKLQNNAICTDVFFDFGLFPALWNKIIRREILVKNQYNVDSRVKMGEDAMCIFPALFDCREIVVLKDYYPYHYRQTDGNSVSRKYDPNYFRNVDILYDGLTCILKKKNCDKDVLRQLNCFYVYLYIIGLEREVTHKGNLIKKFHKLKKTMVSIDKKIYKDLPQKYHVRSLQMYVNALMDKSIIFFVLTKILCKLKIL